MWLMKSPSGSTIQNGTWMFHNWVNGFAVVGKQFWYKFFKSRSFKDQTPDWMKNLHVDLSGNGKRVLVIRPGGFGDQLMMTAALKVMKLRYPKLCIDFGGVTDKTFIMKENKEIRTFLRAPQHALGTLVDDYDNAFDYTGLIAADPRASLFNAYDLYIKETMPDVSNAELRTARPQVILGKDEEIIYEQKFSKLGLKPNDKYFLVSIEASSPLRNWEIKKFHALAKNLVAYYPDRKVVMIGLSDLIAKSTFYTCKKCKHEDKVVIENLDSLVEPLKIRCKNCKAEIHLYKDKPKKKTGKSQIIFKEKVPGVLKFLGTGFNIREVAYLIKYSEMVIGVDTGTAHIAAAFAKKQLVLFGAFDGDLRLRYFEEASWIQHEFPCAPCFLHTTICPLNEKTGKTGVGACMKDLSVKEVFKTIIDMVDDDKSFRPEPAPIDRSLTHPCVYVCGGEGKFVGRKGESNYYQCLKCLTIFTPNPPKEFKKHYNQKDYFKVYRPKRFIDGNRNLAMSITSKCPQIKNEHGTWLDIGCSLGYLLGGAKMLGWKIEGVEISTPAWKEATIRLGTGIKNVSFKDYKTQKKFGLISCHQTMEHIGGSDFNQLEALLKMKDLLEDDGLISLNSPCADLFPGNNGWGHLNTFFAGEHICILSRLALGMLCDKAGLEIIEFRLQHASGDFWAYLRKCPERRLKKNVKD